MSLNPRLRKLYRQTYRAVQVHGVAGTCRLIVEKLRRRVSPSGSTEASAFDQRWNVQTDGNEDLSELQIADRTNYLLGNRYQATAPEMFDKIMREIPLRYEDYVFIDCGSGKGRVLLLASDLPFRRIIGVEFASDLTNIAKANIHAYQNPSQKCKHLEAVCMDATIFPFPPEPTVLYLANPFEGPVMEKFLRHVEHSLKEHPRSFVVLYRNPKGVAFWDQSRFFTKVKTTDLFVIYENFSPPASAH